MSASRPSDVTRLLLEVSNGRAGAVDQLFPLVYAELRQLAARLLRGERKDHTLQPTALVHEAYLRLVDQRVGTWENRAHFLGVAAQAMRRILLDHARRRRAVKRDGGRVTLDEELAEVTGPSVDLLEVDAALERLAQLDARQSRVVELRFFGGLNVEETAAVLGVAPVTVKRDWAVARAWLHRALAEHRS
ncbi:MAG TPA: sigma-70 family RNA polymerase sigma factor [Gemmatimonadales bacterium]|jgi:RNA polymerase sigma factor (TIGR02999 family)